MSVSVTPSLSRSRRTRLLVEELEDRRLLAALQPSVMDQVFLERLNDARSNPAAYGTAIGVDLSNVAASQPLAFNPQLIAAAEGHSQDMNARNYFDHFTPDGVDPGARISATGFVATTWGESIGAGYMTVDDALAGLIVDAGVPSLGHRMQLLAMTPTFQIQSQVGIGVVQGGSGQYRNYYTVDTGATSDARPFLTGVVFKDANGNGKYDAGEGLSGVTLTVSGVGSFAAWNTGGFSIQLNPGTYTVTASGGQLGTSVSQTVTIGSGNFRLNFTPNGANTFGGGSSSGAGGGGITTVTTPPPVGLAGVANQFTHSAENFGNFITQAYSTYLKRTPDAPGLNNWINQMASGAVTDEQLEASFIGSPEYIADHGGNPSAWVRGMYQDLLGRAPADGEVSYWVSQMAGGMTPASVAYGFAASPEREASRIRGIYETFLSRDPSASEVSFWVNQFVHGTTSENVEKGFISSQEYYDTRGNGTRNGWVRIAFQQVLHRQAADSEVAFWSTQF